MARGVWWENILTNGSMTSVITKIVESLNYLKNRQQTLYIDGGGADSDLSGFHIDGGGA